MTIFSNEIQASWKIISPLLTIRNEDEYDAAVERMNELLDEIGRALKEEGISLEEWIERGREIRGQLLEEMYGLKDE